MICNLCKDNNFSLPNSNDITIEFDARVDFSN